MIFGSASLSNLKGVHPKLVRCCEIALIKGSKIGFDFSVVDGVRTDEEAKQNVASGVSWTTHSQHLVQPDGYGHAVDLRPYPRILNGIAVDGSDYWKYPEAMARWNTLNDLMQQAAKEVGVQLRWGGLWQQKDMYHFELRKIL